jgi:predicted alpha/beta hydrolase family esterase
MKKQIVVVHGGDSFETYKKYLNALRSWEVSKDTFSARYDWKSNLAEDLNNDFEILSPRMPNKQNAKYVEWKIWLERMIPFLKNNAVFVGHSMGGLFLVKYLTENKFPKNIGALYLVAAPHSLTGDIYQFQLKKNLQNVWTQCQNIHIFQSKDDPVVPFVEAERYQKAWPGAKIHIFKNRGHFNQEHFPELVREIKKK